MGQRTIKNRRREEQVESIIRVHHCTREQALVRLAVNKKTIQLGKLMGDPNKPVRSELQHPVTGIDRFKKPGEDEEDEQDGEK